MKQMVREPTRKMNLLDLVLTTMHESSKVTVLPTLADHRAVLTETTLEAQVYTETEREVWHYRDADWKGLKTALRNINWDFLRAGSANDNAERLTQEIITLAEAYIPKKKIKHRKSRHPWITRECEQATEERNLLEAELLNKIMAHAASSEVERLEMELQEATKHSNLVLGAAYEEYVDQVREEIKSLPKGSNKWWRLNRILLGRSSRKAVSIPPLRDAQGNWVLDAESKADLFGKTFDAKSRLPEKRQPWNPAQRATIQAPFFLLRRKSTLKILKDIDIEKATGPDLLPGRILKECAEELAHPITQLVKQMLAQGTWPECQGTPGMPIV